MDSRGRVHAVDERDGQKKGSRLDSEKIWSEISKLSRAPLLFQLERMSL
jgi:hypothetical protein